MLFSVTLPTSGLSTVWSRRIHGPFFTVHKESWRVHSDDLRQLTMTEHNVITILCLSKSRCVQQKINILVLSTTGRGLRAHILLR